MDLLEMLHHAAIALGLWMALRAIARCRERRRVPAAGDSPLVARSPLALPRSPAAAPSGRHRPPARAATAVTSAAARSPLLRPFVQTWGEGPPVLFLHGLGASCRYWETLRRTSGGYRGIAVDLLGFGRSPKPAGGRYDVEFHLAALAPLVTPGTVLVAHSTGAVLAAALAARERPRVRALLLLGLPAYDAPGMARQEVGRIGGSLARWTLQGLPLAHLLCALMCCTRPLGLLLVPYLVRDVPSSVAADGLRHTWASYSRTLFGVLVGHPVLPDLLALTGTPVVVLQGGDDRTTPVEHVESLVAQGAPIELRRVEGDHHLALRRPSVVAASLEEMLERTADPEPDEEREPPPVRATAGHHHLSARPCSPRPSRPHRSPHQGGRAE